jgi:hypothetical protein
MSRRLIAVFFALSLLVVGATAPSAVAKPKKVVPSFGATSLELDPGAAEALGTLGVSASPIAPGKARGATFSFPITTNLGQARKRGHITHRGGIRLEAGSVRVDLTDFTIRLRQGDLTARVGDARVPILDLAIPAGTKLRPGAVGPVPARLTATAAGALNDAFGVTAFEEGLLLGHATIRYGGGGRVCR